MQVRAELHFAHLATVTFNPSWLEWLCGKRGAERFAVRLPSLNGGYTWLWDATGRPVEPDALRAIERAVARRAWQEVLERTERARRERL